MPRVYRSMTRDGDKPLIGDSASALGVRVPIDIEPDGEGKVHPGSRGMSVAPDWRKLPDHRIPTRLRIHVPKARGNYKLACFRMGEGPFEDGPLTNDLLLRIDKKTHGVVSPASAVSLEQYRAALASTQDQWVIDEE